MTRGKVGVWFVGIWGGVAATAVTGLLALRRGLTQETALATALEEFSGINWKPWNEFVIGGCEIRQESLYNAASELANQNAISRTLIEQLHDDLDQTDAQVRMGLLRHSGKVVEKMADPVLLEKAAVETPREAITRIQADLNEFVERHKLEQLIVVNLMSTEPQPTLNEFPQTWDALMPTLNHSECPLPASSLYAIAALELGYDFINFTPSLGSTPNAIQELSRIKKARHAGNDGKTGETLMKSVLAPMFAYRNLDVMSWVGHNIFGNRDSVVLNEPENKATKITSKDKLLAQILGYKPQTLVTIENIASLGDWKTAWDHIHFRGFLGTPMTLQFTWQGCDSLLAAPLVLDMLRLTALAAQRNYVGRMDFLSCFFKSPLGVEEQGFIRQFQKLEEWINNTDEQKETDE